MPTASAVDPLSACSVFVTAALQLGHLQRDKETDKDKKRGQQEIRGRSPRGGCRSPGPSLTRRVSASTSPRSHGGGGEGAAIERSVSTDGCESGNNKRGDSRNFYEYWSYYNSHPASIVRSATSEMADDILSSADGGDGITAPLPSTTRTQPLATAEGATTGASESAAVNASEQARAAGEAARASRAVAVAKERWAKEAKLRLQELRKHSGNR